MKRFKKVKKDESLEMKSLRKSGMSVRGIARLLNRSHSTIVWHTNLGYQTDRKSKLKRIKSHEYRRNRQTNS